MGMQHNSGGSNQDYFPKTYEPIVPPKPTIAVPPALSSPPMPIVTPTQAPSAPLPGGEQQVVTPSVEIKPSSGGGNGAPACSGPNSYGYNVSTGKCDNTQVHAIVPRASSTSTVVHLSSLPYTGNDTSDVQMSAAFYLLIIGLAVSGIAMILKWKHSFS